MCPSDEAELVHMTATAAAYDDGPSALRYPRGTGIGAELPKEPQALEIGKARLLKQGSDIAILSLGTMLDVCLEVADKLEDIGVSVSIADARFAKPFDRGLVRSFAISHEALLLVEESSPGGFSAHILQFMAGEALLDNGLKVRTASLPDEYIDHAERSSQLVSAGLDVDSLFAVASQLVSDKLDSSQAKHSKNLGDK